MTRNCLCLSLFTSSIFTQDGPSLLAKDATEDASVAHVGRVRDDLPEYANDEIRRHDSLEKGVWVTYKDGVYDITKFIQQGNHPGGNKIDMAAGWITR